MIEQKYYFTLLNFILITLGCYLGVDFFYDVTMAEFVPVVSVSDTEMPSNKEIQTSHTPAPADTEPLSHYKTIAKRDLFKVEAAKTVKENSAADVTELQKTELELKLWGTAISGAGESYAVIQETQGDRRQRMQMLYHKGDKVQGAVVEKILDEKVVLSLNGDQEILEMEDMAERSASRYSRYSRYNSRQPSRSNPVHYKRRLKRSQIEDAMANLTKVMGQIRVYPHKDGIKVSHIKSRSIFRKMGLRNGDIITGINGQSINSVDDAMGLYEQLKSSSNVSLQLKRRGREKIIDYNIM